AGVFIIATAVSGYFLTLLKGIWRLAMAIGGLFLVAPGLGSDLIALVIIAPVVLQQLAAQRSLGMA
ncbi:MAG: hypothetical protein ACPG4X_22800, partial [Pikeienuella sp.]